MSQPVSPSQNPSGPGTGLVAPESSIGAGGPAAASPQRRVPSGELFRGAVEVEIVHHDQVYRLRQTALGKLILTK